MIPIVERLDDAPETGDCWLRFDLDTKDVVPVRNGNRGFLLRSVAGWNTKAIPWCITSRGRNNYTRWDEVTFAPTAEDAIRAYHADPEKCPFGEVRLVLELDGGCAEFQTVTSSPLLSFYGGSALVEREALSCREVKAMHALIGEVIVYQEAVAAGHPERSAAGRALANK